MPILIRRWISFILSFSICYLCGSFAYPKSEPFFGLDTTPRSFKQDLNDADELGMGIMRIVVWWQHLEPAPGEFTWEKLDGVVGSAQKDGLEVLLQLMTISDWGVKSPSTKRGSYHSASMPVDLNQWSQFLHELASRYKGKNVHYEIDNEVNAIAFWSGTLEEYTQLLKVSYEAIKDADANAIVLPSAMGCGVTKGLTSQINPAALSEHDEYLRSIFKTNSFDIVNVHNYYFPSDIVVNNFSFESYLHHIMDLMKESGVSDKPIWVTEGGYPSEPVQTKDRRSRENPEEDQARWLNEMYSQAKDLGVQRVFWIIMRDRDEAYFGSMGLMDQNGRKRPAWQVMYSLLSGQEYKIKPTDKSKSLKRRIPRKILQRLRRR